MITIPIKPVELMGNGLPARDNRAGKTRRPFLFLAPRQRSFRFRRRLAP